MDVCAAAAPGEAREGVPEGVSDGVEEDVRAVLGEGLGGEHGGAEGLAYHGEHGVVLGEHERAPSQAHHADRAGKEDAEATTGALGELHGRALVAGVHDRLRLGVGLLHRAYRAPKHALPATAVAREGVEEAHAVLHATAAAKEGGRQAENDERRGHSPVRRLQRRPRRARRRARVHRGGVGSSTSGGPRFQI